MTLNHLRDVTNDVDLGIVLKTKQVSKQKLRITTTLLTLEIDGKQIVRGRLNNKALYGATVEHNNTSAIRLHDGEARTVLARA
eukprot:4981106-Prymnesium_polylepis.1